jgi:tetratricopeptide (TPR) repeat protein
VTANIENGRKNVENDTVSRKDLLVMLRAAQSVNAYRFSRQAAMEWLSIYPNDLEINFWLAKALIGEGRIEQALEIIEKLCAIDPEYAAPWRLAAELYEPESVSQVLAVSALHAQGHPYRKKGNPLPWSYILFSAREHIQKGDYLSAEKAVYRVLNQYPDAVLGAILHLKLLGFSGDQSGVLSYSRVYRTRWPNCLNFSLLSAKAILDEGQETEAMQLFQQCVASDPEGRIATRLWGKDHVYKPMWPGEMRVRFGLPIPADVACALGLNKLSKPKSKPEEFSYAVPEVATRIERVSDSTVIDEEIAQTQTVASQKSMTELQSQPSAQAKRRMRRRNRIVRDPELAKVEKTFDRLAEKYHDPKLSQADGRFPVYVVFSTRAGLEKKFGEQIRGVIENEMQRLASTVAAYSDWDGMVFIPDDPGSVERYGLTAVEGTDPWSLKLALADLDRALAEKGSMIGALLIVGGDEVVPFHHLPNPTDDMDEDVPSDNPYAALDGNYFVPEWPVGRLPDEKGSDPAFLLKQIRKVISEHSRKNKKEKTFISTAFLVQLIAFFVSLFVKRKPEKPQIRNGFGYSAAVWRRASIAVFRPIGDGQALEITPPEPQNGFDYSQIMNAGLGYFNLHGLADAPEWYGQRDITEPYVGPDYPVALRPSDLVKNGKAPRVVFSEACYGGHVFDKRESDSVALRFLNAGTSAVVASTCVAYGSVSLPLIGADMLANLFWQYLQEGMVSGEALLRAKVEFVQQMEKRQGFMDGEDQKTMISFVLYGDPLARGNGEQASAKSITRLRVPVNVRMVCDIKQNGEIECCEKGVVAEAKQLLKEYLPGVENADVSVAQEYQVDKAYFRRKGFGGEVSSRSFAKGVAGRTVITVRKEAKSNSRTHHHYARVTMDRNGKMVKLAISR